MQIRNHITEILCALAILLCMLFGGGTSWYECIIPAVLLVIVVCRHHKTALKNPFGILLFAILVMGFISIVFTHGDKQNALYEYEKLILFVLAVYAGASIKRSGILYSFLICSVVLAAGGLMDYCGLIKIPEFTFNDRYVLRLQSFVKYANTAALLLGCGYYAAEELYARAKSTLMDFLSSCILIALYLTVSKAAIPIFLAVGTVLIFREQSYAPRFILQNILCMMFTVLILFTDMPVLRLLIIITGIVLCTFSTRYTAKIGSKALWILWVLGICGFVLVIGAFLLSKGVDIFRTLFVRFDYMSDAVSLLKENALSGIGPGAWRYYQYSVQTTQYSVTYIHNSWLQILVEYGIVFFILMLVLTAAAVVSLIKKKDFVLSAVLFFVILHSMIDMNLSFGACLILLGFIIGNAIADAKPCVYIGYPVALICAVTLIYMAAEYCIRSGFEKAYLDSDTDMALSYAQRLEKLCPYDSRLQISLAAMEADGREKRIERAVALSPLDYILRQDNIINMINNHDKDFFDECRTYISLAKKQEQTYVNAKEYIRKALDNGICTIDEYDGYLKYIEEERLKNNVIDRNELLEQIRGKSE